MHIFKNVFILALLNAFVLFFPANPFNMGTKNSAIEISNNANFVLKKEITSFKGKVIKNTGATISGENITFDNGIFQEGNNENDLTGVLDETNQRILLNGNKSFKGIKGQIKKALRVSGNENRLEGDPFFANDISLVDVNSSLTCAVVGALACDVNLNNGTIYLENDLNFIDEKKLIGPGKVKLNKRTITFGAKEFTVSTSLYFDNASDIELNSNMTMNSRWTFSGGENIFNGNGNIVYLKTGGQIIVERGSSLLMKDVVIHKISGDLCCLDNLGTMSFQNIKIILDHDCSFTQGIFDVLDKLTFAGAHTWAYQSGRASKICTNAKLVLEQGVTFSYDPSSASRGLINMQSASSTIVLKNSTLHSTSTGIQLAKGILQVEGNSFLSSEASCQAEGIMFGDGLSSANDLSIEVLRDSSLKLLSGYLIYNNFA